MTTVAFVNGPYDGHNQTFNVPADRLFTKMAVPVNRNVFRALAGQPRGPEAPASSVAVYQLRDNKYVFVESSKAAVYNLQHWRV